MTPEQATRLALDIGREVTDLVQRRLNQMAQWDPPNRPIHEDEQPVGTFGSYKPKNAEWSPAERKAAAEAQAAYRADELAQHPDDPDDGGVKRQVIRTLTEDDGA